MEENNIQLYKDETYDSKSGKGFKKIFKNFSLLTLGKLSGDFFTFILFVVLSRKFGREGVGQYSFAVGLTGFFAVCADFGLYSYTIKEISKNKNSFKSYFSKIFSLRLLQSAVIIIILFAIIPFLNFSLQTKIIIIFIGIYQIIYSSVDGISAVFIAHEYMHVSAGIEASFKVITSFIAVSIALLGGGIVVSLSALPVLAVIEFFIVKFILRKKIGKSNLSFSLNSLKSTFIQVMPYGVSDFLNQLYNRIDIVLIGFLLGESFAGIYNVGYRVVFFLFFIPKFASIALFPIISRLFHESKHEFQKMYDKTLNMIMIVGLPVSAGLWLISSKLIKLVFGADFAESSVILQILAGLFLLICLTSVMQVFLMSSDRQIKMAKGQWIVTCISTILNGILIYFWGIEGAAIAVLISSFILVIIYGLELKSIIGFPKIKSRFLISMFGVLAFCIPFLFMSKFSIFLIVPASILIYISVILIFKDIRKNELRMIQSLFSTPK